MYMIKPSPLVWFHWCLPPSCQPSVSTAQPSVPSAQPSVPSSQPSVHWHTKIGISDAVTKVQNVMMSGASLTFFCTLAMHQNCDNYLILVNQTYRHRINIVCMLCLNLINHSDCQADTWAYTSSLQSCCTEALKVCTIVWYLCTYYVYKQKGAL